MEKTKKSQNRADFEHGSPVIPQAKFKKINTSYQKPESKSLLISSGNMGHQASQPIQCVTRGDFEGAIIKKATISGDGMQMGIEAPTAKKP